MTKILLDDIKARASGIGIQSRVARLSPLLKALGVALLLPVSGAALAQQPESGISTNLNASGHSLGGSIPSFGAAPIKRPDALNYSLFLDSYQREGNAFGLVDTEPTPHNIELAKKC